MARLRGAPPATLLLLAAVLATSLAAVPASAQRATSAAPVFIEPGHWAWDAVRRLTVLGVAPASGDPALAPMTLQHARMVLDSAAAVADASGRHGATRLARGYARLLAAESGGSGMLASAEVIAGWASASGEVLAGDGYFVEEDWEGAQPLEDGAGPIAMLDAHGWIAPWLSWQARGGRLGADWAIPEAALGLAVGPFDAWAGRRRLHYAIGHGGGTVLGTGLDEGSDLVHRTRDTFDGIGIHVRDPFHFPGFLRILGPARIEAVGGRLDRNGRVEAPYVVFGRLIGTPFTRRFTLGINRGAIFGGEGNPITAGRLAGLIIGLHGGDGGEFENQVFSVMGRLRPPLGPLPLELYAEFGMDDTAGAISDMPGIVAGVDIGAVPGLNAVSVGVEHAQFPGSCCGNPIWYRSIFFRGSWADEGRLFAHPLAGHGREWRVHGRVDLPEPGLLVRAGAYARWRGHENLYAPGREGESVGGSVGVDYRPKSALRVRAEAALEQADSWDTQRMSLAISYIIAHGRR